MIIQADIDKYDYQEKDHRLNISISEGLKHLIDESGIYPVRLLEFGLLYGNLLRELRETKEDHRICKQALDKCNARLQEALKGDTA